MDAVLFDLFGTIVPPYRRREHHVALRRIADVLGVAFESVLDGWTRTWDDRATGRFSSIGENLREIVPSAPDDAIEDAHRHYHDFTVASLVPKPGALDALDWLIDEGIATALVTNCAPDVPELWRDTKWAARFDVTVFSCAFGAKKPDRRIYVAALDGLGVPAERAVFVGDGSDDELAGAAAVGLTPVLVRNDAADDDRGEEDDSTVGRHAVATVDHLSDLPKVLSEL